MITLRTAAGVAAGDEVEVDISLDEAPRETALPPDLADVLGNEGEAREFFDALAPSRRLEWLRWVEDAKKPEKPGTRALRVSSTVAAMKAGKKTR